MKILTFDEIILKTFGGKIGRFNYFLSLLIVLVGYYYLDTFYFSDRCLVCFPVLDFPWRELIGFFAIFALLGLYFLILACRIGFDYSFSIWPVILPIIFTMFFIIQTIKRCHENGESGWRFLIPIYSPLLILFLPAEIEVDKEPEKSSALMILWKSKWLILILILMIAYIYLENLEYIRLHNAL